MFPAILLRHASRATYDRRKGVFEFFIPNSPNWSEFIDCLRDALPPRTRFSYTVDAVFNLTVWLPVCEFVVGLYDLLKIPIIVRKTERTFEISNPLYHEPKKEIPPSFEAEPSAYSSVFGRR